MKTIITTFILTLSITLALPCQSQDLSPDKFIDKVLHDDNSLAFRLPGWLIRKASVISSRDMEENEQKIIRELSKDIKRLRVLVNSDFNESMSNEMKSLQSFLTSNYDNLIDVRDKDERVNIWANMEDNTIKDLVISVLDDESQMTLINIKTKLDMDKLKSMNFFKELKSL